MNISIRKLLWVCFCWGLMSPLAHAQTKNEDKPTDNVPLDLIFRNVNAEDYNGSAFTVRGDMLRDVSATNLLNVLSGLVPGFYTRQTSGGLEHESPTCRIRGVRTNSEGVLTLVDGQERSFGMLSPHEIESITVLKDAAAAALYGMRASNGIILVKTRQGAMGGPKIDFSAQLINQQPLDMVVPLGAADYAQHYNRAMRNDGSPLKFSAYDIWNYRQQAGAGSELYPDVAWLDKYYRSSTWLQRYNLNVSGGTDKARYFVNAGYIHQGGMFNTDNEHTYPTNNSADRYNLRSNIEMKMTPTTLLNVDLYGWYESDFNPSAGSGEIYQALLTTPAGSFPEWFADNGTYFDDQGNKISPKDGRIVMRNTDHPNPWAMLNRNGYTKRNRVYGSFRTKATQDLSVIAKGLEASAILSMDAYTVATMNRPKGFASYIYNAATPTELLKNGNDGVMSNNVGNQSTYRRTDFEAQLSYNRTWKRHRVSALAFYEQYEDTDDTSLPTRLQGIGGWLSYNYGGRYGIDFTLSRQGSQKLAKHHRFGTFPAVAVGWTLSNEKFFSGLKPFLSYFKLRASYGQVGNVDGIDPYVYNYRMQSTNNVFFLGNNMNTGITGYHETVIANPSLTWETATQLNVGLDLRLFRDKLSVIAEYFEDDRSDMYVTNNNVSSLIGTPLTVSQNVGKMHTQGCDIAVMWNHKIGQVGYSIGGTYAYSSNVITQNGEIQQLYPWLQAVGFSRGIKKGYIAEGLFGSWEEIAAAPTHTFSAVQPGDIRYKDINGDGIINTNDRAPIGYNDMPQVFYGLTLGLSYKGLSLSALFQGASKLSREFSGLVAYPFLSKGTLYEHQLNYWTPETAATAQTPRLTANNTGNNVQTSSFWIQDADYLRLKTLELAYTYSTAKPKKSFVKGMKIYVSGYNLFTWSDFKWIDPEASADFSSMPLTRNVSMGCHIKF